MKKILKRSMIVMTFVLVFFVVYFLVCLGQAVRIAFRAETELHSTRFACELVREFIESNNGKWPQSWNELENFHLSPINQKHLWPDDSEIVKSRVFIDFLINLKNLNSDALNHFDGIHSQHPGYGFKHYSEYQNLLESMKTIIDSQEQ